MKAGTEVTRKWLRNRGCSFKKYPDGSQTAFSANGFVVANQTADGIWKITNRPKQRWAKVALVEYDPRTVPEPPKNMSRAERVAWRLWRQGLSVRIAAEQAGITPNQLRLLLGMPLQERADNPPKSQFVEEAV